MVEEKSRWGRDGGERERDSSALRRMREKRGGGKEGFPVRERKGGDEEIQRRSKGVAYLRVTGDERCRTRGSDGIHE